jgi:hypothetical protein
MKQAELDREVCRVTGESRDLVRRMGFSLLVPPSDHQAKRRSRRRPRIYRFQDFQRNSVAPKPA